MAQLKVGIPLYPNFDSLDVMGPLQTFTFAAMDCYLVAESKDLVTSFENVSILPHCTFDDCPQLDVIFTPGGSDPVAVLTAGHLGQNAYLDFLAKQAPKAQLVCSVCTGALLLAGAGLLDGCTVTTHWAFKEVLKLFPCTVVDDYRRYVQSGNRITGAGISSGMDVALYIVAVLCGVGTARQGQLAMQYNPKPPLHCGDPGDLDIKDQPEMVPERMVLFRVEQAHKDVVNWLASEAYDVPK